MQVAILAGGLATRLGEFTRHQPKAMVRIEGKPFLQFQLEFLRRGGVTDIVLCLGHLGEQIESYFGLGDKFGMSLKYSYEKPLLGTAGALKNAQALLQEVFFTLYGDSYVFVDFKAALAFFASQNKLALMTVYQNFNRYDRSNTVVEGGMVKKFSKEEKNGDMVYIDYGVNIFRKQVLEMVPEGQPYSLEELFPRLIERKEFLAWEVKERFYEIGSPQGLKDFTDYVRRSQ